MQKAGQWVCCVVLPWVALLSSIPTSELVAQAGGVPGSAASVPGNQAEIDPRAWQVLQASLDGFARGDGPALAVPILADLAKARPGTSLSVCLASVMAAASDVEEWSDLPAAVVAEVSKVLTADRSNANAPWLLPLVWIRSLATGETAALHLAQAEVFGGGGPLHDVDVAKSALEAISRELQQAAGRELQQRLLRDLVQHIAGSGEDDGLDAGVLLFLVAAWRDLLDAGGGLRRFDAVDLQVWRALPDLRQALFVGQQKQAHDLATRLAASRPMVAAFPLLLSELEWSCGPMQDHEAAKRHAKQAEKLLPGDGSGTRNRSMSAAEESLAYWNYLSQISAPPRQGRASLQDLFERSKELRQSSAGQVKDRQLLRPDRDRLVTMIESKEKTLVSEEGIVRKRKAERDGANRAYLAAKNSKEPPRIRGFEDQRAIWRQKIIDAKARLDDAEDALKKGKEVLAEKQEVLADFRQRLARFPAPSRPGR
jgi:hypothetical protein